MTSADAHACVHADDGAFLFGCTTVVQDYPHPHQYFYSAVPGICSQGLFSTGLLDLQRESPLVSIRISSLVYLRFKMIPSKSHNFTYLFGREIQQRMDLDWM